jgi:beta-glucanase (GH16 family)
MKTIIGLLALVLAAANVSATPTVALQSGVPVNFALPASSFTTSFYVDVVDTNQSLRIDLDSNTAGVDIGFYMRFGTPFPDTFSGGLPVRLSYIGDMAHYRSTGITNDEFVIVGKSGGRPLRAGRWYLFAYNFNTSQSTSIVADTTVTATLSDAAPPAAEFSVNFNAVGTSGDPCSNSEWFDTTAVAPIGGNPGTTRGEQRRNAMLRAAANLAQEMRSPVPISIDACWDNLGTGNSVTLAQAGPRSILRDTPSMEKKYTWYAGPAAARVSGTSFCRAVNDDCGAAEIRATFNNQVDTPNALGASSFYYGYDPGGGNNVDFISVGMHEIAHGLGFISLVALDSSQGSVPGSKYDGFDDIFSSNIAWLSGAELRPFNKLTDAERMTAAVSGNNLRWNSASAAAHSANPFAAFAPPDNLLQLYAPNPISAGSSVSHLNQSTYSDEMMRPFSSGVQRELSLGRAILDGAGWSNTAATPPIDPVPLGGFYYDPRHTGHGIEFSPVTPGGDLYVLTFYTYDEAGNPEWFQSVGRMVDGKFLPETDVNDNSIQRYVYDPTRPSGQRHQVDPTFRGTIQLDFVQAANSPVCAAAQSASGYIAVMSFALGNASTQEWCMQELIPRSLRPANDLTGIWYAGPQDSGWGFSLGSIPDGGSGGLFSILYYYDAQGNPRWALSSLGNLQPNSTAPMISRAGYCRTCAIPAGFPNGRDTDIGAITFNMQAAGSAGSTVTYSATWNGAQGGTFARTASPMVILSTPAAAQTPHQAPPGYALIWSDEFNVDGLPDPGKWAYDTEANATGWYNNERQYYSAGRLENSQVSNGVLSIIARKEALTQAADYGGQQYTSARMITRGKASWTYGFIEARAKLPCGLGTWPAIWTLGTNGSWPAAGEIDIMEHTGNNPGRIHGTLHMQATAGTGGINGQTTVATACSAFHNYQMTWTPQSITFGVDGTVYHSYANPGQGSASWPFDQPQYLLLNLAIGGNFTSGVIDDSIFPVRLDMDYVRVYQLI